MGKLEGLASPRQDIKQKEGAPKKQNVNPRAKSNRGQDITIATLNVRTLRTEEREVELENALEHVNYDILGLSEVRRTGEAIIEKRNGDIFYYKGTTLGQKRVGFII